MKTGKTVLSDVQTCLHLHRLHISAWPKSNMSLFLCLAPYFLISSTKFFPFQNSCKDLDLSFKTDLDC